MGIVGDILGGRSERKAAKRAAEEQAQAAAAANSMEERIYNQSREDLTPWREQGVKSLNQLAAMLQPGGEMTRRFSAQDFQTDPGYQFRLSEGQNALSRALAAAGMRNSGAALKEAMRYNQGAASDEYLNAYNRFAQQNSDIYNRLAGVANTGQTTSQQLANVGQNYSSQYGQNLGQAANARASSYVAAGKAKGQAWRSADKQMNALAKFMGLGALSDDNQS